MSTDERIFTGPELMPTADESIDWRRLREFADVDLTASYVLSWSLEQETLVIDIDLKLLPEHPFYEKPRPAEKICIRPATIEFPCCAAVAVSDGARAAAETVVDQLPHGAIHGLRRLPDERYELAGTFGTVLIAADRPILRLKTI